MSTKSDVESWLIWKDPDAGKGWRQEEKGMTEDEMVGWHHWLNCMSLGKLQDGDGQGGLACCSPWGHEESDTTERLKWPELNHPIISLSVVPFSLCLQPFPASGSFQMSQLFASGGQSIGVSASIRTPNEYPGLITNQMITHLCTCLFCDRQTAAVVRRGDVFTWLSA